MPTPIDAAGERGESTDMTDEEWSRVVPLLPGPGVGGRPRVLDMRAVVNAILYLKRTGSAWRELPPRYPNRSSVRTYHDRWLRDGTWGRICDALGRV
ncbi:MAG TPA: transposase [Urbifossiella sp.]|nr:transposase [Urbifossiella sp.]